MAPLTLVLDMSLCLPALETSFPRMDLCLCIASSHLSGLYVISHYSFAIYNPLNLEPSVKLISGLFTLFSQIINEDKTFNGIEFCSHFWEILLRLPLVPGKSPLIQTCYQSFGQLFRRILG